MVSRCSSASGPQHWQTLLINLAIATLAITAHNAVTATVNRDQPQLASVTHDLYPSTPGRARFQTSPIPLEPHGDGACVLWTDESDRGEECQLKK